MTDNLPTTINQDELNAFLDATNSRQEDLNGGGDFLPQLKVNYQDEVTVEGVTKELKPGLFTLGGQDVPSYAKNVKFRPLLQTFQYIDYNKDEEKVVCRSVLFNDFSDEPRDEKGTLRCGKPTSKTIRENPALKEQWKNVNLYRSVDGLVSYDGKDVDGNEVKVENVLCTYRGKGASFSQFDEEYIKLLPKGAFIWDYELVLGTTKHKQDPKSAVNYYVVHFEADFTKRLQLTTELFDTLKGLKKRIDDTNKEIDTKYYQAAQARTSSDAAIDALDITPNDSPLDEDFAPSNENND